MQISCAYAEGYINQEYTGLVNITFGNLVNSWPHCASKEERLVGSTLIRGEWATLLLHFSSVDGSLSAL